MAMFGGKSLRTVLQVGCAIVILMTAVHADEQTFQQASIGFIKTYFQQWSSSNATALTYMDSVFPNQVVYFDKTLDHVALMNAKRRFALRWPERHFRERPGSLKVTCGAQHLCTVWGLVDWECRNQQSQKYATGTSVFSLQLQDGMAVTAEDGFVVSRGQVLAPDLPEVTADRPSTAKALAPKAFVPGPPAPTPSAPEVPTSEPPPQAAQDVARAAPDSHAPPYTNDDIPALRAAYFSQASEHDWVGDWLMAEKKFAGTARSLGSAGVHVLSDINGDEVHVMEFDTNHGPIACMIGDSAPVLAKGSDVRVQGTVSIFIDQTMYLAHCSFS